MNHNAPQAIFFLKQKVPQAWFFCPIKNVTQGRLIQTRSANFFDWIRMGRQTCWCGARLIAQFTAQISWCEIDCTIHSFPKLIDWPLAGLWCFFGPTDLKYSWIKYTLRYKTTFWSNKSNKNNHHNKSNYFIFLWSTPWHFDRKTEEGGKVVLTCTESVS